MEFLGTLAIRRPKTSLVCLMIVTLIAALPLSRTHIDNSLESIVPKNDPDRIFLEDVYRSFGSDESVIIVLSTTGGLNRQLINRTANLVEKMNDVPGVARVMSPFTVPLITSKKSVLDIRSAFDRQEFQGKELAEIINRDAVLSNYLFRLSEDGVSTWAVSAELRALSEHRSLNGGKDGNRRVGVSQRIREGLVRAAEQAVKSLPSDWEVHITGVPYIKIRLTEYVRENIATYGVLVLILLSILLLLVLGTPSGVLLPLLTVLMAVIWTMGLLVVMGHSINIYTSMIPTLLLFIGITSSIHILSCYQQELAIGRKHKDAVRRMVQMMATPCLMTTVTTSAGFATLAISSIVLIQTLGIYMAIGILFSLFISFTLIPASLTLLVPKRALPIRFNLFGWLPQLLEDLMVVVIRQRLGILTVTALLFLIAVIGFKRLEIETHYLQYFRKSDSISRAISFIEKRLTGAMVMDVVLEVSSKADLTNFTLMDEIKFIEKELNSFPEVIRVLSLHHPLINLHRALIGREDSELPTDESLLSQEFFLLENSFEGNPLEGLYDKSSGRVRIRAFMLSVPSKRMKEILNRFTDILDSKFQDRAKITGTTILFLKTMDKILWGQLKGFVLIFTIVFIVMTILMRSLKIGLVSMIPNVMPIFCAFAFMGIISMPMNHAPAITSCIGLGIAIDDTIHFLVRFRKEFSTGIPYEDAIRRAARTVGRAIVFTSIILAGGFSIFLFSKFKNIAHFGTIATTIMIAALLGDLILLPLCLHIFRPFGPERSK
jgi:predicted RND superfamily exporter protein